MAKTYNEVVNHLTRVVLRLQPDPECYEAIGRSGSVSPEQVRAFGQVSAARVERVAAMMTALEEMGFTFKVKEDVIYADSNAVEAFEAKERLLASGFKDREFQIILEYARKWDML